MITIIILVGAIGAFAHPCRSVQTLLRLAKTWPAEPSLPLPVTTPLRSARQLNETELDELVRRYHEGHTVYQLAGDFGIHRTTIGKHLRRCGIDTTPPALHPDDITSATQLYHEGWSLARIATKYHVAQSTIHRTLLKAGVQMRDRHERSSSGATHLLASPSLSALKQ